MGWALPHWSLRKYPTGFPTARSYGGISSIWVPSSLRWLQFASWYKSSQQNLIPQDINPACATRKWSFLLIYINAFIRSLRTSWKFSVCSVSKQHLMHPISQVLQLQVWSTTPSSDWGSNPGLCLSSSSRPDAVSSESNLQTALHHWGSKAEGNRVRNLKAILIWAQMKRDGARNRIYA